MNKIIYSIAVRCLAISLGVLMFSPVTAFANFPIRTEVNYADSTVEGRWDITIDMEGKQVPSWLEIRHSGIKTLIGEFVGASGSSRPISQVHYKDGKFNFSIPPQWEEGNDVTVEGTFANNSISGTIVVPDGKKI